MTGMSDLKRRGSSAGLVALLLVLVLGLWGCGSNDSVYRGESPETTVAASSPAGLPYEQDGKASDEAMSSQLTSAGNLTGEGQSLERMVISNAYLLIEVEEGQFQIAFDKALLLADKYGGYLVSSRSSASGEEGALRSGTISIRVPESAFDQTITDAGGLGDVMSREIDTQDVTEEYVDLSARLKNAKAQEKALLALMDRAKTIDEVLQVRQVISQTQMEIEQLQGRINFLDEHTSFSTVAMSIYETGTDVGDPSGWGFIDALKEALHAFVDSVNEILVALGGSIPVLAILAFLGWIVYKVVRLIMRRFPRTQGAPAPEYAGYQYGAQQAYGAQYQQTTPVQETAPMPQETVPAPVTQADVPSAAEPGVPPSSGADS